MKFIHTGDIHLGCIPDRGTAWSKKRSSDIWRTLEDIISLAHTNSAGLILICGDLFHRQPLQKELKEVNHIFASAKPVQIVITAGNHDYMIPGSSYCNFNWSDNVHFLRSKTLETIEFAELNTVVHGFSYYSNELTGTDATNITKRLNCPRDGKKHFLMLHGGDSNHLPLDYERLKRTGFDYIALGHIHKPALFENTPMAYCGSPEPLDRTEKGYHGCILVTLDDDSTKFNRKFIPVSKASYISCKIKITADTTITSLRGTVTRIISEKGSHNIYSLTLIGKRAGDLYVTLQDISDLGNIIELVDESTPDYDTDSLRREHRDDLIDKFIGALSDNGDISGLDDTRKNALYYGLDALLDSTERKGGAKK